MKRFLLLALSVISVSAFSQETLTNGGMPSGDPSDIMVARVPMGSGTPSVGETSGYDEATPVADGLYHVPGFLPYESSAASMWPRVVNVKCHSQDGEWYCTGYHIDGVLERGEDVYVRPQFIKVVTPVVPITVVPEVKAPVTPVPHVHHLLLRPKKQTCN
jgi:hypothetical protein